MEHIKRCKNGANCVQADKYPDGLMPTSEFHPNKGRCKKCWSLFVQDAPNRVINARKSLAREYGENAQKAVIKACENLGIFAERYGLIDVRAWGCVHIEVKSSTPVRDGVWHFSFNNQDGINGQLVVLVPLDDAGIPLRYSVFPANLPIFFRNGKLKRSVQIISNPIHRKSGHTVLTMQDMEDHEDAWYQIEEVRERISNQLKHGIYQPKRVNKPADKPMPLFDRL